MFCTRKLNDSFLIKWTKNRKLWPFWAVDLFSKNNVTFSRPVLEQFFAQNDELHWLKIENIFFRSFLIKLFCNTKKTPKIETYDVLHSPIRNYTDPQWKTIIPFFITYLKLLPSLSMSPTSFLQTKCKSFNWLLGRIKSLLKAWKYVQ